MPNWSRFCIQVTSRRDAQEQIVAIFKQHIQMCENPETPWYFNFRIWDEHDTDPLAHIFWAAEEWYHWQDSNLEILGESIRTPPLPIVQRLAELFPSVTFDVLSSTDQKRFQHWRATDGQQSFLIKDICLDAGEEAAEHGLRDGAITVFESPLTGP